MRISAAPACLWENICASACQNENKREDDKKRHQGSVRNDLAEVESCLRLQCCLQKTEERAAQRKEEVGQE